MDDKKRVAQQQKAEQADTFYSGGVTRENPVLSKPEVARPANQEVVNPHGQTVLNTASSCINGTRAGDYGPANENFDRIAQRWNAHLGARLTRRITPADVAIMMADVKLARLANTPDHPDSWVDLAGYAALGMQVVRDGQQDAEIGLS